MLGPTMNSPACAFCQLARDRLWLETATTLTFLDGFPVTAGHTLVIPKRHVAALFDLPAEEQLSLWSQVAVVRQLLIEQYNPDGFNVGVNEGLAAGQTVPHAHIHVIPRRHGDVADPRGGVRWVIPAKAQYW